MKLKEEFNLLVIVGSWNINIFNPEWINKYLLPEEKLEAEILLGMGLRVSSKKVRIAVSNNRLTFTTRINNEETFNLIQELSLKVADYLPHTPVSSFGVNFIFENELNESLKKLFQFNDNELIEQAGWSIKTSQYKHCINIDSKTLNLSISQNNTLINFDFNFHFGLDDLVSFKDKINENPILKLKQTAIDIMKNVYELELSE